MKLLTNRYSFFYTLNIKLFFQIYFKQKCIFKITVTNFRSLFSAYIKTNKVTTNYLIITTKK